MTERIDYVGGVTTPLDEDEARALAARLKRREVKTVAVCFVNSYANPANEIRMREILEEELPGVFVSTSSETLPEIFEFERFSTTVANAVLSPLVSGLRRAPRAAPGGRRVRGRPADPALRRRRHDRQARPQLRRADRGLGHRRGRDRLPPHRRAVRLRERHRPGHGRHEHGHLARARGGDAHHERVGASSTATRSASRASRSSRSAPAAARSRGSTPRARCATARSPRGPTPGPRATAAAARSRRTRTPTWSSGRLGGELVGGAVTLDVGRRVGRGRPHRRAALARRHRDRARDPARRERQHGRRGAAHLHPPGIRPARVRARRVRRRRARCTARRWPRSSASRRSSCPRTRASRPRSAACSSTCATTSRRCTSGTSTTRARRRSTRSSARSRTRGAHA